LQSSLSFKCDALPGARICAFGGEERISTPYRIEVWVVLSQSDSAALDLDAVIGARITIGVALADAPTAADMRHYHGIVVAIELVDCQQDHALFQLTMAPALARLEHGVHSRIFTKKSIPDIVKAVIDEYGLDHELELRLDGEHPVEEHVCQYRETDLAFVSRWLEREGIHYFFEHDGDVEKLVLADSPAAMAPCRDQAISYRPMVVEGGVLGEAFDWFGSRHEARPAAVRLVDYDYAKPTTAVQGEAAVSDVGADTQVLFEERFFDAGDGARLATLRAEELRADQDVFEAHGTVVGLRPGYSVDVAEHPQSDLNRTFLVTAARHEAADEVATPWNHIVGRAFTPGYRVVIEAIAADVPFRPQRKTPWPRIRGYELGHVDGPIESDYAQLDDQGRYLVKLMFDESDNKGDSASTRIRMMQPHAGKPEGFHFPLRKGTEVVIAFLGGDPDRPVVAGAVPNADTPSPVTAANYTQNLIVTGGKNRIEIEDQAGKDHVFIGTPAGGSYLSIGCPFNPTHQAELKTANNCLIDVGTNQKIEVGGILDERVTKKVTEKYRDMQTTTVTGPQSVLVYKDVTEHYGDEQETTVNGLRKETFKNGQFTMVAGARDETYKAGQTQHVFASTTELYTGGLKRTVSAHTYEEHTAPLNEMATGAVSELYPSSAAEKYGPTVGIYSTLAWVAPTITLNAPHFKITTPVKTEMVGMNEFIFGLKVFDLNVISNKVTGLKLEGLAKKGEVGGVKLEGAGLSVEAKIAKETKVEGAKAALSGLYLNVGGIFGRSA
jgi:type VI secretion system secreted protein VgrG